MALRAPVPPSPGEPLRAGLRNSDSKPSTRDATAAARRQDNAATARRRDEVASATAVHPRLCSPPAVGRRAVAAGFWLCVLAPGGGAVPFERELPLTPRARACPPLRLTAGVVAVGASPCDRFLAADSRARDSRALDVSHDGNYVAPPVDVAWVSPGGLLPTVPSRVVAPRRARKASAWHREPHASTLRRRWQSL